MRLIAEGAKRCGGLEVTAVHPRLECPAPQFTARQWLCTPAPLLGPMLRARCTTRKHCMGAAKRPRGPCPLPLWCALALWVCAVWGLGWAWAVHARGACCFAVGLGRKKEKQAVCVPTVAPCRARPPGPRPPPSPSRRSSVCFACLFAVRGVGWARVGPQAALVRGMVGRGPEGSMLCVDPLCGLGDWALCRVTSKPTVDRGSGWLQRPSLGAATTYPRCTRTLCAWLAVGEGLVCGLGGPGGVCAAPSFGWAFSRFFGPPVATKKWVVAHGPAGSRITMVQLPSKYDPRTAAHGSPCPRALVVLVCFGGPVRPPQSPSLTCGESSACALFLPQVLPLFPRSSGPSPQLITTDPHVHRPSLRAAAQAPPRPGAHPLRPPPAQLFPDVRDRGRAHGYLPDVLGRGGTPQPRSGGHARQAHVLPQLCRASGRLCPGACRDCREGRRCICITGSGRPIPCVACPCGAWPATGGRGCWTAAPRYVCVTVVALSPRSARTLGAPTTSVARVPDVVAPRSLGE
jgi:hypothetical protein